MTEETKEGKQYYRLPDHHQYAARTDSTRTVRAENRVFSGNVSKTDPLGMYTGFPADPNELPVQDADDL